MSRIKMTATVLGALLLASATALPTMASPDDARCGASAAGAWKSTDEVRAAMEAKGYRVRRIEEEHGCYEAYAFDKDGRRYELYIHPVTLEVVRVKRKS